MADVTSSDWWIDKGPLAVLVLVVWLELRLIRPVMQGVREVLAALLERERIRSERKREPSSPPPVLPETPATGIPHLVREETTDLHEIIERQRRRGGERPPRKGTHHDGDR